MYLIKSLLSASCQRFPEEFRTVSFPIALFTSLLVLDLLWPLLLELPDLYGTWFVEWEFPETLGLVEVEGIREGGGGVLCLLRDEVEVEVVWIGTLSFFDLFLSLSLTPIAFLDPELDRSIVEVEVSSSSEEPEEISTDSTLRFAEEVNGEVIGQNEIMVFLIII